MATYFSLDSIDRILEDKYLNYDNGYFIELGGNDGITQSNTYYFEKFRGWRGLLVEPILHLFFKCKKNRQPSKVYCNACVSFGYEHSCVELLYSNLMTSPLSVETDLNPFEQAQLGAQFLCREEEVVRTAAIAATLNKLMIEAGSPKCIDFLSIDVEGAEAEVIQGIDFSVFSFRVMCVEARDPKKISSLLEIHGYECSSRIGHNLIFTHPMYTMKQRRNSDITVF